MEKSKEQLGRPQSKKTRDKIAKAMLGDKNPAYKSGQRSYRRKAGAKTNDGTIIHHKDGNRSNNSKGNLQKIPPSKRGAHDKAHNRGANFSKSGGTKKGAHTKSSSPKKVNVNGYKKPKKK